MDDYDEHYGGPTDKEKSESEDDDLTEQQEIIIAELEKTAYEKGYDDEMDASMVSGFAKEFMRKHDLKLCCLCDCIYSGYGHNAQPLANGRCCDNCNASVVAERISRHLNINNADAAAMLEQQAEMIARTLGLDEDSE